MTRDTAGRAAGGDEALAAASGRRWFAALQSPLGFRIDRVVVRATGWSYLSSISARLGQRPYTPVLVLTSIGRKSGELREKVLPYVPWDGAYVLIGSNFGGPRDPDWAVNLRATSRCWIRVKRQDLPAVAHIANGEEREAVLAVVLKAKPNVERYVRQAGSYGRSLPLVVVRPTAAG